MARLPRYQRLGVQTRQPRDIDYAGTREAVRYSGAVSEALGKMSSFLAEQGAQEAKRRGLERVRTEGASETLEQIQAQGGPRTIAERTAFEAANKIAVTEIQNEAELQITNILNEAEKNVTPFSQVQAQLADITDGFASTLSAIDPVAAGQIRSNLQTSSQKAGLRYSDWYVKKQAAIAAERRTKIGQNDALRIIKDISGVYGADVDTNILDMTIAMKAKDYVENQGWSQANADAWARNTTEAARKEWFTYKVQTADEAQLEEFRDNIVSGKTKVTGIYSDDLAFANKAQTVLNTRVRAAKAEATSLQNDINEKKKILLNGGEISDDWFVSAETRINGNSKYTAQANTSLTELKLLANNLESWKQMDAKELFGMIETIKNQGIPGYGEAGADELFEVEVMNMAEKLYSSAKAIEDKRVADDIKFEENLTKITNQAIKDATAVMNAQKAQETREWASRVSDVADDVKVFSELFKRNQPVDPKRIAEMGLKLANIPIEYRDDSYEQLADQYQFLNDAQTLMQKLPSMSKEQVAQALKELNQGVDAAETPLSQLNAVYLYETIQAYATDRAQQVNNDLIAYAAKTGVENSSGAKVQFSPFNFTIQEGQTAEDLQIEIQAQFQERKLFADLAYQKFGGQYSFFTKAERAGLKAMLDGANNTAAPVMAQMSILTAMFEGAGLDTAMSMMTEIAPEQPDYAFAGALLTNSATIPNAMAILEGKYKVDVGGFKVPGLSSANTESVHTLMIDPVLSDHSGMMKGLKKSAGYIYATLVDETDIDPANPLDPKIVFNPDKYMQALNMALGATYRGDEHISGGILEYRGVGTIMPQAIGAFEMDEILGNLTPENISLVSNLPSFDALGADKEAILNQIRGVMTVTRDDKKGGTITYERDISDKFELRMLNGNATTGYNYGFFYPGTDVPLSFGDNERLIINLKKLDEAQ